MKRRSLLLLGAAALARPTAALAQPKQAKIGMLGPSPLKQSVYAGGVVQGFADLGYRDGARASLEYRSSGGKADAYAQQARELVSLGCDLYVTLGAELPVRALQELRPRGPIVFLAVDFDPIEKRVIGNLRRPDRNTTGVYVPQNALVAKRIEIMREVLPAARRLLVFADSFSADQIPAARKAAQTARFEVSVVEFGTQPYDYGAALESARKSGVDAFTNLASPIFARDRAQIAEGLAKSRLPSIGSNPLQGEAGYLFALGPSVPKVTRRVADIAVRLLKGATPADIPVEQADEFELMINGKTARALGVKVPESVMARAMRIVT